MQAAFKGPEISIHALLAESDHWEYWVGGYGTAFLSTLSLRRATSGGFFVIGFIAISIHALLAESDGDAKVNI